jgi:sigma-B regulation protein RsbU (phosphoserine phosphatase)
MAIEAKQGLTDQASQTGLRLTDFVDLETLQSLQDGFARVTGLPTTIHDLQGQPITQTNGEHARPTQYAAPIVVEGMQFGSIVLGDGAPAALGTHEHPIAAAKFLQGLANTIAQLCHHAHQLRSRVDELAAVYEMSSLLARRTKLQEVLDTATRQLVETMGLRAASLRLLDEESGVLKMASVANLSPSYLDKGQILALDSPIDQDALAGKTVYIDDLRTDPRVFHREKAREEGLVSCLVTGLSSGGKRIGALRVYTDRPHVFTPFEVSLLKAIAAQVAAAIVNARLRRDAIEAEQLERQVRLAADVQRRMIPSRLPTNPHYQFGCLYEPSFDLGGDFYDFIGFENGDTGLVIADVVGKGVPASLLMASARSALRSHARRVDDISEIMRSVNRRLHFDTLPSEFATLFYAELSNDGRTLKHCNGGHEPLILLRRGEIMELDVGGLALGIDPEFHYEWAEQALATDDLLVLVTDGVTEALNYDGASYGRERLHASIKLHGSTPANLPAELIAKQLFWDVRRFVGLAPRSDDITLVVVRVK